MLVTGAAIVMASSCSNRERDRSWCRCAGAGIAPAPRFRRSATTQQSILPVSCYPSYSCGMQRGRHCDDVFTGFPCSRISDSHRPGRPLAIRPTQGFQCPFDGRVCSGNRRRMLGNEPVSQGDLRTQNGILRQVTLVIHCQFSQRSFSAKTLSSLQCERGNNQRMSYRASGFTRPSRLRAPL